jgi:hypothetical protein
MLRISSANGVFCVTLGLLTQCYLIVLKRQLLVHRYAPPPAATFSVGESVK